MSTKPETTQSKWEKECQQELEEDVRWNIIYSKLFAFSKSAK